MLVFCQLLHCQARICTVTLGVAVVEVVKAEAEEATWVEEGMEAVEAETEDWGMACMRGKQQPSFMEVCLATNYFQISHPPGFYACFL